MEFVRYRIVAKYTGGVQVVLGLLLLSTAALSAVFGEGVSSFSLYASLGAGSALLGWRLYGKVPEREITTPEAAAIASISFLTASLTCAPPFVLLAGMPALDAWFESMSGFTTTGFSLLDVSAAPGSILFLRAFSQWLGGLGFVVITISILLVTGRSAVTFMRVEADEKVLPRIASNLRVVVLTYAAITLLGVAALILTGLKPFHALCYAMAGVSTGGFAVHPGSVGEMGNATTSVISTIIMLMGAMNFMLYYRCWKTTLGVRDAAVTFLKNPQVLCLLVLTVMGGLVLGLTMGGEKAFMAGIFTAASAQTTTGFFITEPASFPAHARLLLVFMMFTGGGVGSTAGGIKLFRLTELAKGMNRFITSQLYPREMVLPGGGSTEGGTLKPPGKGVAKDGLTGVFYVIAVYAFFIFFSTLVFAWSGFDTLDALFEVTSAAATVGLSSGIVSPGLAGGLKALLIFLMWAGRLEFIPVILWAYTLAKRGN